MLAATLLPTRGALFLTATPFVVTSTNAVNGTLYDKLTFNFARDIAPVAGIVRAPNFMVLNPAVPAKTVPEFIACSKANSGKVNFASGGIGTSVHMCGELFRMLAGIDMVHVPYRGEAPGLTDVIGGPAGYVSTATDRLNTSGRQTALQDNGSAFDVSQSANCGRRAGLRGER